MSLESFVPRNAPATRVLHGPGSVAALAGHLGQLGLRRAMVVSGQGTLASGTVDEVVAGLGATHVATFSGTDPRKTIESVLAGLEVLRAARPDVLVGVGGGASLDAARMISLLAADGRTPEQLCRAALEGEIELPAPPTPAIPLLLVPTTLAGADLSGGTAVRLLPAERSPTGVPLRMRGFLEPFVVVYDPLLFDRTPIDALLGSAMNGLDKGVDTLYARGTTLVGRAAAIRGVQLLQRALPGIPDRDPAATRAVVEGIVLVQFDRQITVLHAIAHGFSRWFPVQQGLVHAAIAPTVVESVLGVAPEALPAMAQAWDLPPTAGPADVASRIAGLRAALGLPAGLGALLSRNEVDVPRVAEAICADPLMDAAPAGVERRPEAIAAMIERAWGIVDNR